MNQFKFILQESPWYLLLCIVVAGAFSYFLYKKKTPWSKSVNYFLNGLRFMLFFILAFLLLSPLIKYFNNILDRPQLVVAVDNSQSITLSEAAEDLSKTKSRLLTLAEKLREKGVDVVLEVYDGRKNINEINAVKFKNTTSDLSLLLNNIRNNFVNKNLAGVILVSDGIYNQGYNPTYNQYAFPIHTIGVGDTIQKKDINLKYIRSNKIAYTNTKFPIVAEVHQSGFKGKSVVVSLTQNGRVLEKKPLSFSQNEGIVSIEFLALSEVKGLHRYTIAIAESPGEFTSANNTADAYVEILDAKEKILLVASSPHPDIKAIKSALATKENFDVTIYIPGIDIFKEDQYDLVILHQIPDIVRTENNLIEKFKSKGASLLYIVGNKTDLSQLNNLTTNLKILGAPGHKDMVTPHINEQFGKIRFDKDGQSVVNNYPPIGVPFGNYTYNGPAQDVLLYQKVGSLPTKKPLLILSQIGNQKVGILTGEGIWQWRLKEFQDTKESVFFDKLISNCIQYLSNKDDKRKLRVYPLESEFNEADAVVLETETYNDIYERIYDVKIDLTLIGEDNAKKSYSLTNNENNQKFVITGLKRGIYKYIAKANIFGRNEVAEGQFSVKNINLEALNTTADFNVLQQLSSQTGGNFVTKDKINDLEKYLLNQDFDSVIHTNEEFLDLITLKVLFFILMFLAATEWFIRKYKGSY